MSKRKNKNLLEIEQYKKRETPLPHLVDKYYNEVFRPSYEVGIRIPLSTEQRLSNKRSKQYRKNNPNYNKPWLEKQDESK